jgi:hypothetical protein
MYDVLNNGRRPISKAYKKPETTTYIERGIR